MVSHYSLDGLRLDTALYMPRDFLREFQHEAGVLILGEVVMYNFSLHRSYIGGKSVGGKGPLSSLLNFPLTEHLKFIFSQDGNMMALRALIEKQDAEAYPLGGSLLGNFIDNHDSPRFLFNHSNEGPQKSLAQLRNALTFAMFWHGLPIVYYGTEHVSVSNVSDNRMSMWTSGFAETPLGAFLRRTHAQRARYGLTHGGQNATLSGVVESADEHSMVFVRGGVRVTVNNIGNEPTVVDAHV